MPNTENYRFSQISSFLHKIWTTKPTPPIFSDCELRCWQAMDKRGGISVIYRSLSAVQLKTTYMLAWEKDLSSEWSLEAWQKTCFQSFKGILNISLIEANLKVITRWYMVSSKIAQIYPSSSPICFQGCKLIGNMVHVWWKCPRIRNFWNKIFTMIRKVTGYPIQQSPHLALLNFLDISALKNTQCLIFFILTGAKLTIAKAWKAPSVSFNMAKRKI